MTSASTCISQLLTWFQLGGIRDTVFGGKRRPTARSMSAKIVQNVRRATHSRSSESTTP